MPFSLHELEAIVRERAAAGEAETSWTAKLLGAGMPVAAQKLGEEAVETVIAAVRGDRAAVIGESADLLFHWLVVLRLAGVDLDEVLAELARRQGRSGLAEKAGRSA